MSKPFVLKGSLTRVDWVNPHIDILIDVVGADGAAETWKFESNPPSWFRRVGLARNDIAKGLGQTVTVEGARAKNGSLYGYLLKITFVDGNSLELLFNSANKTP